MASYDPEAQQQQQTTTMVNEAGKVRLADIEEVGGGDESEEGGGLFSFDKRRDLFTRIIQGTACAAILVNILAIALEFSGLMLVAGLLGIGVGGGVAYYQQQLRGEDTLRTVQNELRHKVNDFADENEKLTASVSQLEQEVEPLKETEEQLAILAEENGMTVDKLSGLVKTNKRTLKEMQSNLRADVLMSMMDVVLQADRSEDGVFSDREISGLILRLKMLPTINMNEALFKAEIAKITQDEKQQLSAMLKLMEQINHDHIPGDQRVFMLKADAMDKML